MSSEEPLRRVVAPAAAVGQVRGLLRTCLRGTVFKLFALLHAGLARVGSAVGGSSLHMGAILSP